MDVNYTDRPLSRLWHHKPFGYRVRQLLMSLNSPQPAVLLSHEYISPPYAQRPLLLCPGIMTTTKSGLPSQVLCAMFTDHTSTHHSTAVPIFTDGSRRAQGAGFAAILPTRILTGRLRYEASVFSAELLAILPALAYYILCMSSTEYFFYSDSKSVIQSICNPFSTHPVVREVHRWLRMLHDSGKTITFCWVPGHVGVEGNETADREAAAVIEPTTFIPPVPLPFRDYFSSFASLLHRRWLDAWHVVGMHKLCMVKNSVSVWATSCCSARFQEVILSGFRIDHTRLTHRHLISPSVM